jgi:hypothetical protein
VNTAALSFRTPGRSAPWLVLSFGTLVAANAALTAVRGSATVGDLATGGALLVLAVLIAQGLRRGARWAWWASLALAGAGLFFVLPLAGTILLGGPTEPVGTGWDMVFFPLTAAILVALVIALWTRPKV